MDQHIVCLYFQSQQQSYMVNRHNRDNPANHVNIDEIGAWQEAPTDDSQNGNDSGDESDEDPHENLCEYEVARRNRIRNNEAMIASLNIRPLSDINDNV